MMSDKLILKIRRGEGHIYSRIRRLLKSLCTLNPPYVKPIHLPLYYIQYTLTSGTKWLFHFMWSIPLFKARCEQVGRNVSLPNGLPFIVGSNLKIYVGNNVTIYRVTIGASKVYDEPVLRIGDNSAIGYGTVLSIALEVDIGDNSMIGPMCMVMDNDDHPISPARRLKGEGVTKDDVSSVRIGNNVWIGSYCTILKGITIGDNSIIAAHSVVTKNVIQNSIYAGYPARPTCRDIDKESFNVGKKSQQSEDR